jgi:hypothetical protein
MPRIPVHHRHRPRSIWPISGAPADEAASRLRHILERDLSINPLEPSWESLVYELAPA